MRLFLLIFFLLYGGLHYYLFVKANAALALGTLSNLFLILIMLFWKRQPTVTVYPQQILFRLWKIY